MLHSAGQTILLLTAATFLSGCVSKVVKEEPEANFAVSKKDRLKIKDYAQLENYFTQALGLSPHNLCNELDAYKCIKVHSHALGGTEPHVKGIFKPLKEITVRSVIAIERLALSGCRRRTAQDFADLSSGVIFRDFSLTPLNLLEDPGQPGVTESIARLFMRAHGRPPTEMEVGSILDFYYEVATSPAAGPNPVEEWATLTCFATMTMLEGILF